MKQLLTVTLTLIFLASCRKEVQTPENDYLTCVQAALRDSLPAGEMNHLDFDRAVLGRVDSAGLYLLRIPFKGKQLSAQFVLLQTTRTGAILQGRIVQLQKDTPNRRGNEYNGAITIRTLKETVLVQSAIVKGYFTAYHGQPSAQRATSLMPPEYQELPEVVVVASYSSDGGIVYSDWMRLTACFDGSGGNYYYSMDGSGSEGGSSGGGGYSGGSGSGSDGTDDAGYLSDSPILIDYETDVYKSAIELEQYLKCFDQIPDAGATCSIEIFADIPVDSDPYKLFDIANQSPGHTFIQIKKSNGSQSVLQNVGFYPQSDWKSILTTAPISGKFVDNGGHEFNASLKMSVSPEHFRSILTEIRYLAGFIQYDIDEYNCTDFALDVFNKIRTNKLEIPMYDIPSGITAGGTRTPQGLYQKLKQMKEGGGPEASNISLSNYKCWVAYSSGPCN